MVGGNLRRLTLLMGTVLAALPEAHAAHAQASDSSTVQRMNTIEGQIRGLQDELRAMRRDLASRDAQLRAAQREAAQAREEARRTRAAPASTAAGQPAAGAPRLAQGQPSATSQQQGGVPDLSTPPAAPSRAGVGRGGQMGTQQQNASTTPGATPMGTFRIGGVTVTLGGFAELDGIFRTRNEVADISSNFNTGIPLPNSPLYHENEFRGSSHQSRLSLLMQGDVDSRQKLAAYVETDFQGAAPTANSVESNSYNPRLRQFYGTYDNSAWGLHVLAGQAWSLVTLQQTGITPRKEALPGLSHMGLVELGEEAGEEGVVPPGTLELSFHRTL